MKEFTAIPVYNSKTATPMNDLIEKYFSQRSKSYAKLDIELEFRLFAAFLETKPDTEVRIDPKDANVEAVIAAFQVGAIQFIAPETTGGKDYTDDTIRSKKRAIAKFKTAVQEWSSKQNINTLNAIYDEIINVANYVPQQILVCDSSQTYKNIFRFMIVSVSSSENILFTLLSGAAANFITGIVKKTSKLLTELYTGKSVSKMTEMLLMSVMHKNGTMHRVCNACFLYFVTRVDVLDANIKKLLHGIRFVYPVMAASSNTALVERVRETADDVLTSFCESHFSHSDKEGFVYTVIFANFKLLWYEIVPGLVLRFLFCCHYSKKQTFPEYTKQYSVDQLLLDIKGTNIDIGRCPSAWEIQEECVSRIPTIERRPWDDKDYVALFCWTHGSVIDTKDNITIPDNVILVKMGVTGRRTVHNSVILANKLTKSCTEYTKDLHNMFTYDAYNSGCEIVPSGVVYPNLALHGDTKELEKLGGLFGCNEDKSLQILLDIGNKTTTLEKVLDIAYQHAKKTGQNALVFLTSCQSTEIGEKVSVGTDAVYQAINNLPDKIKVVTFDGKKLPDFDILSKLDFTIKQRLKQEESIFKHNKYSPDYKRQHERILPITRRNTAALAFEKRTARRRWDGRMKLEPLRRGGCSATPASLFALGIVTVAAALFPR